MASLPQPFRQLKATVKPLTEAWMGGERGRHIGKHIFMAVGLDIGLYRTSKCQGLGRQQQEGQEREQSCWLTASTFQSD